MLRDYQLALATKAYEILQKFHIVYLSIEMRVGKTCISLKAAEMLHVKNVLFVTKKKAISSIQDDYDREQFNFKLTVTNYEQLKHFKPEYDLIIVDEAHSIGKYPKSSNRFDELYRIVGSNYLILNSGTPTPESYSQIYHQFGISKHTPFQVKNFYAWAKEYVNVTQKIRNGIRFNDYSDAYRDRIMQVVSRFFIKYTQQDAGFTQHTVEEHIQYVDIDPRIHQLVKYIMDKRIYTFKDGQTIVCDTPVKLQTKIHQLFSGTVKTEDGMLKVLDNSKAEFVKSFYAGKKIAIFYKFIAEGNILKSTLTDWTEDPQAFNQGMNRIFISQIQSGSMGINLSAAEILIFYNIDFSAVQYWQARARLQSLERDRSPIVHWLFSRDGIEQKVLDCVQKKKDYTLYYFRKDYHGSEDTSKNHKVSAFNRSVCN
jgi:SNF2 family DNA or RNA helicase